MSAVKANDEAAKPDVIEYEIGGGQDAKVKEYAQQTLPTVLRHLEDAKRINSATLSASAIR